MKVVFVGNDTSIITGENADARERMRLYAKRFDSLTIVVFSLAKDKLPIVTKKNLTIYPTNSVSRWYYVPDTLKILSKIDFDLISTQDPFIAGLVGVLAKLFWHKKLNIQIHNDFFNTPYFRRESLQNYIFYWLGRINLVFADSVRVVNKRLVKTPRYFAAPVPTDLDFFWGQPRKRKIARVVCVARLAKQKNLPMLVRVVERLGLDLTIVGEGEERKNLPAKYLVGQKDITQVKKIYEQSDLFVLPSNYEGWGLVAVEALASGLPVVMTDTGCAGEVVINNVTGKVVPVENEFLLEKAVLELLKNPVRGLQMVKNGQKLIKKNYDQHKLVGLFVDGLKRTA